MIRLSIRLDALAAEQFGVSREEAAALIMEGRVFIEQAPADKPGTAVPDGTVLTLRQKEKRYASRSGYKLEKALDVFGIDPAGLCACDIGASNGGFTDCLLQRGTAHVFAVDVAYGILEWRLREDPRVTVMERQNARHLTADMLGEQVDLVTADVSFISLTKIFPAIDRILKADGRCVTLIKPQFEAPRQALGKNGIVKDRAVLPPLFTAIAESAAACSLFLHGLTVSPIHGQNGNVEYLAVFSRTETKTPDEIRALCAEIPAWEPDAD